MTPHILVILGSTRQGRNGEAVATWIMEHVSQRADATFELVDLKDWSLPFFDSAIPPARGKYEDAILPWVQKVASADGYIFVTPEYNHGYPAVLKNALDHVYEEWGRKPGGIVSYGSHSAGYRAAEQLRQVLVELRIVPIRAQVGVPAVWAAFDEAGHIRDTNLNRSVTAMLDELLWWTNVLKAAREGAAVATT